MTSVARVNGSSLTTAVVTSLAECAVRKSEPSPATASGVGLPHVVGHDAPYRFTVRVTLAVVPVLLATVCLD